MRKKKIILIEGVPSDRDLEKLADELLKMRKARRKKLPRKSQTK